MDEGVIQQMDDPQNLYLEPHNLFVAKFIGNPGINVLKVELKDGKIIHEGFEFPVSSLIKERFKTELADGTYLLGARPEDMHVKNQGIVKVDIASVELIGRERILNFKIGSQFSKSIVSIEHEVVQGDTLEFDFNYNKIFLFNEDGSRVY